MYSTLGRLRPFVLWENADPQNGIVLARLERREDEEGFTRKDSNKT